MSAKVTGYCPMGCGDTLFLGSGGYVTCSLDKCPNPGAASDILNERETGHIVRILGRTHFELKHPLHERIDDKLLTCTFGDYLAALPKAPMREGIYRVHGPVHGYPVGDHRTWRWEKVVPHVTPRDLDTREPIESASVSNVLRGILEN